jgi:hypothetical protein
MKLENRLAVMGWSFRLRMSGKGLGKPVQTVLWFLLGTRW